MYGSSNLKAMWFSFPWRIWTANIPWTVSSLLHFSCWLLNKELRLEFHDVPRVPETNPHPFLFTVPETSFYDNSVPFCKCYTHSIFWGLNLIVEQSVCTSFYTERITHSSGRNRFHFQIKQQANKIEKNKPQPVLLGPPDSCCSFVTSYMRPGTVLLFLITVSIHFPTDPPATLLPHRHTHSHSSPGCSLSEGNATVRLPSLDETERQHSSRRLATSNAPVRKSCHCWLSDREQN